MAVHVRDLLYKSTLLTLTVSTCICCHDPSVFFECVYQFVNGLSTKYMTILCARLLNDDRCRRFGKALLQGNFVVILIAGVMITSDEVVAMTVEVMAMTVEVVAMTVEVMAMAV